MNIDAFLDGYMNKEAGFGSAAKGMVRKAGANPLRPLKASRLRRATNQQLWTPKNDVVKQINPALSTDRVKTLKSREGKLTDLETKAMRPALIGSGGAIGLGGLKAADEGTKAVKNVSDMVKGKESPKEQTGLIQDILAKFQ